MGRAAVVNLLLLMASGACSAFVDTKVPGHVRQGSITLESGGRHRKFGISMFVPEEDRYQRDDVGFDSRYGAFESPSLTTVYGNSSMGYTGKADSVIAVKGGAELPPSSLEDVVVPQPSGEKGKKGKWIHCQQIGRVFVSVENPPPAADAIITIVMGDST